MSGGANTSRWGRGGKKAVLDTYLKLCENKIGTHWLWCAIERIASGEPEVSVLEDYGYLPENAAETATPTRSPRTKLSELRGLLRPDQIMPPEPEPSGETMDQREEVCAAWADLPDQLRQDRRLTRLYLALGGPAMHEPAEDRWRGEHAADVAIVKESLTIGTTEEPSADRTRLRLWFDEWELVLPPDARQSLRELLDGVRYVRATEAAPSMEAITRGLLQSFWGDVAGDLKDVMAGVSVYVNDSDMGVPIEQALAEIAVEIGKGIAGVTSLTLDPEDLIRSCVPGGSICDPQAVADAIRAYFAAGVPAHPAPLPQGYRAVSLKKLAKLAQWVNGDWHMENAPVALGRIQKLFAELQADTGNAGVGERDAT